MKRMMTLLSMMLLLLGVLAGSAMAQGKGGGPADRQSENVYWFDDGMPTADVAGDARLVRTDSGVSYNLRTTGLTKGDATSVWWVIFNNPDQCAGDCGMPDLFDPAVAASVQSGGGNMVGGSGNSTYASHLRLGETTNDHPVVHGDFGPPAVPNPGLTNPRGAEIHLVVRSHGPAIPGMNHAMFNSFEVGCTAETSGGAGEGPNACSDLQFTAFFPPNDS
jgi:hypothetical protein